MRKSISVAFFSLVSTLMVLGIVLMGASEWVLFKNYFAKDRYETLDQVVGVTQRTAQYLVQQAELPKGDELDALSTKLEIIGESAEAYLFFTDNDGRVMIASSPDKLESLTVPEEMMEKIDASDADYYHVFGTLGGMLDGKITAAKALGGIRHLLQRVGELAHQDLGQDAGTQQHHTGRQQEVGPELLLELGQLLTGRAQE